MGRGAAEELEKLASKNNNKANVDDSRLGWKLFAGYNLNQYFGAEFAYVDLGEVEAGVTEWERYGYGFDKDKIRSDGDVDFFSAGVMFAF